MVEPEYDHSVILATVRTQITGLLAAYEAVLSGTTDKAEAALGKAMVEALTQTSVDLSRAIALSVGCSLSKATPPPVLRLIPKESQGNADTEGTQ